MYPYATTQLQEQIIATINTTNTKLDTLNTTINYSTTLICTILVITLIRHLILKCLGAKNE